MKVPDIGNSILVQPSDLLQPTEWLAYDAYGRLVEVGELGSVGSRIGGSDNIVARLVCGRQFYADLRRFIANQTRGGS